MANMFAEFMPKRETRPAAGNAPAAGGNDFYDQIMEQAGAQQGIPSGMMAALRGKETGGEGDPTRAVSTKGAYGLGQVLPSTWRGMGYTDEQMSDPAIQAEASAKYLRQMYDRYGDWRLALQAYHDGPGNTDAMLKGEYTPGPEGRNYVDERFNQWAGAPDPSLDQGVPQRATAARRVSAGNMFAEFAEGGSTQQAPARSTTGGDLASGPQADPVSQARGNAAPETDNSAELNAWAKVMPGFVQQQVPAAGQNAPQPTLNAEATQPQSQPATTPQNAAQSAQQPEQNQSLFDQVGNVAASGGRMLMGAAVDVSNAPLAVWDLAAQGINNIAGREVVKLSTPADRNTIAVIEKQVGAAPGSLETQGFTEDLAREIIPYFVGPGELKALEKVPGAMKFVADSVARNFVGSATQAAKGDGSIASNLGVGLTGDAAFKALGKAFKPVWNGLKGSLGFGTKTATAEERSIGANAIKATEGEAQKVSLDRPMGPGVTPGEKIDTDAATLNIAQQIDPDEKVLAAARRLGMEDQLSPSHYARNRTTRQVLGAIQSVTGSEMDAMNARAIATLAEKADDLINIAGGTRNKVALSEKFKNEAKRTIDDLGQQADDVYNMVRARIPDNADAQATDTVDYLLQRADTLRGEQHLSSAERKVLDALNPKGEKLPDGTFASPPPPSYALLDQMRRDVGEALYKNSGPFRDAGEARLSQLYAKLTADQEKTAIKYGADDLWNAGKKLVAQRKDLEDRYLAVVGKNEAEQAAVKYGNAIQSLQKGDSKNFDQLIENTPPNMRKEMVSSALADVFSRRAQKGDLNIPGFVDWYNGAKKTGTLPKVLKHLDKESRQRFVNIANVAEGIRRGNEFNLSTGKLSSFIERFNSGQSPFRRLFGMGLQGAAYGVGVASGGVLGGVIAHGVNRAAAGAKHALDRGTVARIDAADEVLSSPQLLDVVKAAAYRSTQNARLVERVRTGTATPAEVKQLAEMEGPIRTAERKLEGIPAWQRLKATMTAGERADLKRYGPAGWLAGFTKSEANKDDENEE